MNLRLILASTLIGASLVACGGGGSTPSPSGTTVLTVGTPVTQSVTPSITTSGSSAVVTPSLTSTTLGDLGLSTAPTISAPSSLTSVVPANTQVSYSNTLPSSIATFSVAKSGISKQSSTVSGATGLIYEAFTPSTGFTVPAATAITFTFPFSSVTSGVNYYLAFFNGSTWTADTTDVGIVNGNTVSISINTPAAVNFTASTPYAFVLYSLSSTTATAAPTTSATTAPTKAPTTSATTAPTTAPTTSATTSPTTAPALATGTLSLSSTGSTSASATIEGAAGNLTLPAASQSGSIAYSISSSAPTGVTALSGVNMVYGYATITPAASFTFPINSTATASLTTTSTIPSGSFLLAYSTDGVNWVKGIGTSSTSNGTVTISASNTSGAISLTSGTKYYLAIYQ